MSDKKTFISNENIRNVNQTLDTYYMLSKTDLFGTIKSAEKIYQKSYEQDSFEFIESIALPPTYANHPIIQL